MKIPDAGVAGIWDAVQMELHWVGGREVFVSWREMWRQLYPTRDDRMSMVDEPSDSPAGDDDAREMNRLRGVAIVQAAETEAVLGGILNKLDPAARRARPAGVLFTAVKRGLDAQALGQWAESLDYIRMAIERRNTLVHNTVSIGYSWAGYTTGDGGEHIPVISFLGQEMYDEEDLRKDIELQREATLRAVKLLHHVTHGDGKSVEASDCRTCLRSGDRV
jgi:hypothetical protein